MQRYCAYQERCHKEVRSKLIDLEVYGQTLEQIMAELVTDDFLNEERFAKSFARGKFRLKQWGRLRIIQELKRRDISEYCIKKALEEIDDKEYLEVLAKVLFRKSDKIPSSDSQFIRQSKLAQYAISRGYEPEFVWERIKKEDEL